MHSNSMKRLLILTILAVMHRNRHTFVNAFTKNSFKKSDWSLADTSTTTTETPTTAPTAIPSEIPTFSTLSSEYPTSLPTGIAGVISEMPTGPTEYPTLATTEVPTTAEPTPAVYELIPSPRKGRPTPSRSASGLMLTAPTSNYTQDSGGSNYNADSGGSGFTTPPPTRTPSAAPAASMSRGASTPSLLPTKSPIKPTARPSTSRSPTASPLGDMHYHPGTSIMSDTVNLYNIYYGAFSASTMTLVDYFATNLASSSWMKTITNYYQVDSSGVKKTATGQVVFKARAAIAQQAGQTTITDNDIVDLLIAQFNNKNSGITVDPNAVYTIMINGALNIEGPPLTSTDDGQGNTWLNEWCGYHSTFALNTNQVIKYNVIGDPSTAPYNGASCYAKFPPTANGNLGADSMVSIYGHELFEQITDYDQAWYFDANGYECADSCNWDYGTYTGNSNIVVGSMNFLVQRVWLPGYGCTVGYPVPSNN